MLTAWIERFALPNDRGLVFTTRGNQRVDGASWTSQDWHVILKHAGLYDDDRRPRFHALRHFCASWMLETGWSVTETAQHLGHASFDMTLSTYSHVVYGTNRRHDMIERSIELALPLAGLRAASTVLHARETQNS
jgi:integrase